MKISLDWSINLWWGRHSEIPHYYIYVTNKRFIVNKIETQGVKN